MHRHIRLVGVLASLLAALAGCATVDPRPDYDRASRHVERAIGNALPTYDDDAPRTEAIVSELLAGGLTADGAVKIALLNNPNVRAALSRVGMARADAVQAGLFSNPTLGLSLRLPEGGGRANLEASLAQNIADLWLIPPRKRAAERDLDRTILDVAREVVAQVAATKTAYYDALAADQTLEIARDNLALTKQLLDVAEARRQAGAVGALDSNFAKGQALRAEVDYQTARLEAGSCRRTLAKALGLTIPADDLRLAEPWPAPPEHPLKDELLVPVAREFRLDLRAARDTVAAAEARLEAEYAKVFPTLDVGLDVERGERRAQRGQDLLADAARASIANGRPTAPEIQSRAQRRAARSAEIDAILGPSIGLTLPVFDQNQAQIAKARLAYQQAGFLLDALERGVVQETREAIDQASTAWSVADLYERELVPQALDTLTISEAAYQAGHTTILNVVEAQRSFLDTRRAHIAALRSAANAAVDLERTIGRPLDAVPSPSAPLTPARAHPDPVQPPEGGSGEGNR